jgi:hypothetical protein
MFYVYCSWMIIEKRKTVGKSDLEKCKDEKVEMMTN